MEIKVLANVTAILAQLPYLINDLKEKLKWYKYPSLN